MRTFYNWFVESDSLDIVLWPGEMVVQKFHKFISTTEHGLEYREDVMQYKVDEDATDYDLGRIAIAAGVAPVFVFLLAFEIAATFPKPWVWVAIAIALQPLLASARLMHSVDCVRGDSDD